MCVEVTFQRRIFRELRCMCVGLGRGRLSNDRFVKAVVPNRQNLKRLTLVLKMSQAGRRLS